LGGWTSDEIEQRNKMKNRILIFVIIILLTNFLSAYEISITLETPAPISMFSGETEAINSTLCHDFKQTQELDLSYNITNNTFNLDGLYISFSENPVYTDNCKEIQIFISTDPLYKPDSWVLEIYAETLYEGKIYVSRGGRSSSYWECGEWSDCINGTQTRICEDINRLKADRIETRECILEFIPIRQETETNETEETITTTSGFFPTITGAVIGGVTNFVKSELGIITFISLIVILIIIFAIRRKRKG